MGQTFHLNSEGSR